MYITICICAIFQYIVQPYFQHFILTLSYQAVNTDLLSVLVFNTKHILKHNTWTPEQNITTKFLLFTQKYYKIINFAYCRLVLMIHVSPCWRSNLLRIIHHLLLENESPRKADLIFWTGISESGFSLRFFWFYRLVMFLCIIYLYRENSFQLPHIWSPMIYSPNFILV